MEEARLELHELVKSLTRIAARTSHKLGIKFDTSDPRVDRELLSISFGALVQGSSSCVSRGRKGCLSISPSKPPANAQEIVAAQRHKLGGKG